MTYKQQSKVNPQLDELHHKQIDAVNGYIDRLSGTVISIETIRHGQPRPYADSEYEAIIFCHRPNMWTTNGPCPTRITEEEARWLAKRFVLDWDDSNKTGWGPQLQFIRPEKDPCGLDVKDEAERVLAKHMSAGESVKSCCWRVRIVEPYSD